MVAAVTEQWNVLEGYQGCTCRNESAKMKQVRIKMTTSTDLPRFRLPSRPPIWMCRRRALVSRGMPYRFSKRYHIHKIDRTCFGSRYELDIVGSGGFQMRSPPFLVLTRCNVSRPALWARLGSRFSALDTRGREKVA